MFSLTISGATLDEFNGAIAAFAAGGAVSGKTTSRKVVVAPAAPKADPAALTAEQAKAIDKGDTVALSPAQVEAIVAQGAAPTAAELEQEVRALLTPLLRDPDQAPKVADLMAKFGATKLSKIPADKMAEVLAEGKVLAAAATKVPA